MSRTIRRYAASDAQRVLALFSRTAAADATVHPIGEQDWDRFLRLDVNAGGAGFPVAEGDGDLVGLATSSLRRPGKSACLQVSSRNDHAIALHLGLGFVRTGASLRYRAPRETVRQVLVSG